MSLKLYNTLSNKIEEFKPTGKTVGVYTCGLTVQGLPHLGHMRAYIFRDILVRWLQHSGYDVKVVENFTDIDDKIIAKQREQNKDWRIIAEDNIDRYLDACDRLNIKRASIYPRASQHIEEIIELVEKLIDKGYAYEKGGDVYFRVRNFATYGKLSNKTIDELVSGARIAPTEHKDDPLDFALWKAAKSNEPYWLSPWGKGRPGWHIECSAMSMHYLGETFDIHTGGEDLIFPHHENEIAQSNAATDKEFVRYWLHNGWVTLQGEKMAKSTGHFFLIKDLLKEFQPNIIRLYLLKTHYRKQIDFSTDRLEEARVAYLRLQTYIHGFDSLPDLDKPLKQEAFTAAMDDDLNTSEALGIIFGLVREGYEGENAEIAASVKQYLKILGFSEDAPTVPFGPVMVLFRDIRTRLEQEKNEIILKRLSDNMLKITDQVNEIEDIFPMIVHLVLDIRNALREDRNYEFADYIRNALQKHGIQVQDKGKTSNYRLEAK